MDNEIWTKIKDFRDEAMTHPGNYDRYKKLPKSKENYIYEWKDGEWVELCPRSYIRFIETPILNYSGDKPSPPKGCVKVWADVEDWRWLAE